MTLPTSLEKKPAKAICWLLLISLPIYLLDQISKWLVVGKFYEPGSIRDVELNSFVKYHSVNVIDGFFRLTRVHNTGMAFGLGNGTAWAPFLFTSIYVVALVGMAVLWRRNFFSTRALKIAFALLIAGICGNFTDRLVQGFFLSGGNSLGFWEKLARGYVVDFLDVTIPGFNYPWPAFNVADSCICIAAALIFIAGFFPKEPKA